MATSTTKDVRTEAKTTPERVAGLRDLAASDPVGAQDAAWAWFERLGRKAADDQAAAEAELADLFACGTPSRGLDGPTDGILVAPMIQPAVDRFARALTAVWMPWMGKRFHSADQRGDNRLTSSTRWVARLLWPFYSTRPTEGGRIAFDFETRIEKGGIEPAVDVLVIDYAPVEENPGLIIRSIRDELVEIVPRTHLGRILYRGRDGGYSNIGYFALRN
jgi:hypothetical protein